MPFDVFVNVYDLTDSNKFIYPFGLGMYHSGVEINEIEYVFGGHPYEFTGIFKVRPRDGIPGIKFRQSLHMGQVDLSQEQLDIIIAELGEKYTGTSYHLMGRNCNHFTAELVNILCNKNVPGWINRLAGLGSLVPCFTDTSRDPANTAANPPARPNA